MIDFLSFSIDDEAMVQASPNRPIVPWSSIFLPLGSVPDIWYGASSNQPVEW
jgi:hypothetical protein